MHQVGGAVHHQHIAVQLLRQGLAAIDQRRGHTLIIIGRAVGARHFGAIAAIDAQGGAHRPYRRFFLVDDIFIQAAGAGNVGIAHEIFGRKIIDEQRIGVEVAENQSGVILGDAPLAAHQIGHDFELVIPFGQHIVIVLRDIDGVVHAPVESVGGMFDIAHPAEAVLDHLFGIGHQIAIGVAGLDQIGRLADQGAAMVQNLERAGQDQSVLEHGALVIDAVAVGILQDRHIADRLFHVDHGLAHGIALHFDHPQPAVAVELGQNRVLHQRLGRHQLHLVARRHVKCFQFLRRRQGGREFGLLSMHPLRPGAVQLRCQGGFVCGGRLGCRPAQRRRQGENDAGSGINPQTHDISPGFGRDHRRAAQPVKPPGGPGRASLAQYDAAPSSCMNSKT